MPTLWGAGVDGSWDYLALDLLGSSLHSLFWRSNKSTMDLRSVLSIGMQVVSLSAVYVFLRAEEQILSFTRLGS